MRMGLQLRLCQAASVEHLSNGSILIVSMIWSLWLGYRLYSRRGHVGSAAEDRLGGLRTVMMRFFNDI